MSPVIQSPRSIQSFGVIGVLSENCKIYYDSVFTPKHIGRISDLLSARLRGAISDELRFRIILTFSFHEVYRCQIERFGMRPGDSLPEPLTVECGIDKEKIAIGVSLSYPEEEPVERSLPEKIAAGTVTTRFERFVAQMAADADQVLVRFQPETRRVEVVSILGLTGSGARSIEVVELGSDAKVSDLPGEYVELGDLDYRKLLEEDGIRQSAPSFSTGEILVKAALDEKEAVTTISGNTAEKEQETRISGVTQHIETPNQEIKTVHPDYPDLRREFAEATKQNEVLQQNIQMLTARISELEARPKTEGLGSSVRGIFKNWFGSKKESQSNSMQTPAEAQELSAMVESHVTAAPHETDPVTEKLLRDQVDNLESTIARMKQEAGKIAGETKDTRAQKWADGMIGELIAEKSRIQEMAKKLQLSVRQKEYEFRNRETYLNEQLRRKDELLRQKTLAFDRAREQVSQLSVAAERSRTQHHASPEELALRQKLNYAQKLLQVAKDEGLTLTKQIEEMRAQNTEFKRANQLMMEKLSEIQKPKAGGAGPEELRKKLEKAMKLAANYQKESEQLKLRIKELELHLSKIA